jgi:hypothetical protein
VPEGWPAVSPAVSLRLGGRVGSSNPAWVGPGRIPVVPAAADLSGSVLRAFDGKVVQLNLFGLIEGDPA